MSLRRLALELLLITDPDLKAECTRTLDAGGVATGADEHIPEPPGLPGRPARPELVPHTQLRTRGMGSREGRLATLHAVAHIEFNAINLALDAAWRFPGMPDAFYTDWLQVAREEAIHFMLLRDHLAASDMAYGDLPAHGALWEMVHKTRGDVLARVALVPRTLEARGLDASPPMRTKLLAAGDTAGAAILDVILRDEIGHVAIGNRWYRWLCESRGLEPVATYRALAQTHDAPRPRGPFNIEARRAAGFEEDELAQLQAADAP